MVRIDAGKRARPRRPTDWDVAMRLPENHAAGGQPSHVGCLRLRVPAKTLDVAIEIVTDDENHIWMARGLDTQAKDCKQKNKQAPATLKWNDSIHKAFYPIAENRLYFGRIANNSPPRNHLVFPHSLPFDIKPVRRGNRFEEDRRMVARPTCERNCGSVTKTNETLRRLPEYNVGSTSVISSSATSAGTALPFQTGSRWKTR